MVSMDIRWMQNKHFKIGKDGWYYDEDAPKELIEEFKKFFKAVNNYK